MKIRALILLCLLGGVFAWLERERGSGRMGAAEQGFLDFLVANARERFDKNAPKPADEVVLVEFREEDKAEFSAWPPAPIDHLMVLKRLVAHEPDVVAFAMPLTWDAAQGQFANELRDEFLKFPFTVLGYSATAAPPGSAAGQATGDLEVLGLATSAADDASLAYTLTPLGVPEKNLRTQMQLGFLSWVLDGENQRRDLFVARFGDRFVPSLAAQVVGLYKRVTFTEQRLRFGRGAGLYLGSERFVPLAADGTISPKLSGQPVSVNALELMTPDLGDEASREVSRKLGKHKLIVISTTPSSWSGQASDAAWALALPTLKRAPLWADWAMGAAAALAGLWQLRRRRLGALVSGFVLAVGGAAVCLVGFQAALTWWSPMFALGSLVASTLFCFVWPRGKTHEMDPSGA